MNPVKEFLETLAGEDGKAVLIWAKGDEINVLRQCSTQELIFLLEVAKHSAIERLGDVSEVKE